MKTKTRLPLIAGLVAVLVLVLAVAAGLAYAQDSGTQTAPAQNQAGPQNGPGGPGGPGFRGKMRFAFAGEVTKVDGNTITVKGPKGQERSFNVDDNTKYLKQGGQGSLSDVTVGEHIGIRLDRPLPTDGSNPVAKAIVLNLPAPGSRVAGDVTAVDGDTVTIHTKDGDKQIKVPAITPGMKLGVQLGPDGSVRGINYNPPNAPQPPAGAPAPQGDSGQQQS